MGDLGSGIDYLKQAKALIRDANIIMLDNALELKALEDENAELKAMLAADGSNEYMELPLDADGVPIRVGDVVYRTGDSAKLRVSSIAYVEGGAWVINAKMSPAFMASSYSATALSHKKPEQADSWEKLEEDAKKRPCFYFDIDEDAASCDDCPHGSSRTGTACWLNARLDMIARAKKLAGNEEEAER